MAVYLFIDIHVISVGFNFTWFGNLIQLNYGVIDPNQPPSPQHVKVITQ